MRSARKTAAIVQIYLSDCFAYPASTFIWVIADVQTAALLPAVWLAAGAQTVAGMDHKQLITYYLLSMTFSQFLTCYMMWDIAWDIREGVVTSFLVRPFSYFVTSAARNVAWRVTKTALFVPLGAVVYFCYLGFGSAAQLHPTPAFWASVLLAHTLSFAAAYAVSLTAFWTVEFFSILRIYLTIDAFMSGRLFPLAAFPPAISRAADYLPFRYTNAFQVETIMGQHTQGEIWSGIAIQIAWLLAFILLGKILFERGVRRYAGVGM